MVIFAAQCYIVWKFIFLPHAITLFVNLHICRTLLHCLEVLVVHVSFFGGQQVLNMVTAVAEICDTQSAMSTLGYESEIASHKYVYLHAWSAVGYQNTIAHRRHT